MTDSEERDETALDRNDLSTVLITGAATGIGLATARLLATNGWRVVGTALPGQDTAVLRDSGAECLHVDLTEPSSLAELIRTVATLQRLDAFVSNAGIAVPGPIEGLSADDLYVHFQLNAIVPMQLAKVVLPQLRATSGHMVFMGAGQGRVSLPFGGPYGGSKSALAALTDALRAEIADTGVTVSLIEPGAVRTGILTSSRERGLQLLDSLPAEISQRYRDPMLATLAKSERAFQRALSPAEISKLIQQVLESEQPSPRYVIGREAHALAVVAVLPARLRARLVARFGRRVK